MDAHHTVVDLATVSIVLACGPDGLLAALCNAGLVHTADGFEMRVVLSHDLLASISQFLFIPLNRFEKAL